MDLEEVKKYLYIDFNDDDGDIEDFIETAEAYIDKCCGEGYKTDEKCVKLANLVKKKMIADMYEKRSSNLESKWKKDITVTTIFDILSNSGEEND